MKLFAFTDSWVTNIRRFKEKLSIALDDKTIVEAITSYIKNIPLNFKVIVKKLKDLRETNYWLGKLHYENGNLPDAIFRFKLLKYFYPNMLELNYLIGRCYIERNQFKKASIFINSYLKSNDLHYQIEAKYCYDLINGRTKNITKIPLSIVKRTFNLLAPKYNSIFLDNTLSPQNEIFKAINNYVNEISSPFGNKVLDLGCGTGYIAELLKLNKVASSIQGVDLSPIMISICSRLQLQNIPCYDQLFEQEIDVYLSQPSESRFNVIITSKILNYYSDVQKLITACKELLLPNGCIAFNYKVNNEKTLSFDSFFEEFQYSDEFILDLIKTSGLTIHNISEIKFPDGDLGKNVLLINKQDL